MVMGYNDAGNEAIYMNERTGQADIHMHTTASDGRASMTA
jgi:hypothetical protein